MYTAQRAITVNSGQVTGTWTDYPMLVLNPTSGLANPNNLKTTANGGPGHQREWVRHHLLNAAGALLPFELVRHGQANTTYVPSTGNAEFHVSVASITDGTIIYMCYGNSAVTTYQGNDAGTWSPAKAVAAWHFANGTTTPVTDSTGNNTAANQWRDGHIREGDGGLGLSGTSQYVTAADSAAMHIVGDLTISMWVKPASFTNYGFLIGRSGTGNNAKYPAPFASFIDSPSGIVEFFVGNGTASNYTVVSAATPLSTNTWTKIDMVKSGSNMSIYFNGSGTANASGTTAFTMADAGQPTYIGGREDFTTNTLAAEQDEIIVYNNAKSNAWRQAQYNNESAPASFYAVGTEVSPGGAAMMSAVPSAIPNGHAGNITLTLTGVGTSWSNASTVFTIAGVSNVTKVSQNVTSATAATLVVTTAAGTGSLNISETVTGSASTTIAVGVPSFSIDVVRGNLSSVQTLTLTGTNTVWSQEAAGVVQRSRWIGCEHRDAGNLHEYHWRLCN